jgi:hypothetical protein
MLLFLPAGDGLAEMRRTIGTREEQSLLSRIRNVVRTEGEGFGKGGMVFVPSGLDANLTLRRGASGQ